MASLPSSPRPTLLSPPPLTTTSHHHHRHLHRHRHRHRRRQVTFTNKAARELRERLTGLLGPAAADAMTMGTFHSLSLAMLRRDIHRLQEHGLPYAGAWPKWSSWLRRSWSPRAHRAVSEGLGLPYALHKRGSASQIMPRGRASGATLHQTHGCRCVGPCRYRRGFAVYDADDALKVVRECMTALGVAVRLLHGTHADTHTLTHHLLPSSRPEKSCQLFRMHACPHSPGLLFFLAGAAVQGEGGQGDEARLHARRGAVRHQRRQERAHRPADVRDAAGRLVARDPRLRALPGAHHRTPHTTAHRTPRTRPHTPPPHTPPPHRHPHTRRR